MKFIKTYEELSAADIFRKALFMRGIDSKNKVSKITPDDPYGEEEWEITDKDDVVKNNVFKNLTDENDRTWGQIYDLCVKCDSGDYYWIGKIKYFRKPEKEPTEEEIEASMDRLDQDMLKKLPPHQHLAYRKYMQNAKEHRRKVRSGEIKSTEFIVYFYEDRHRYRKIKPSHVENLTSDETDQLFEELKKTYLLWRS